MSGCSGITAGCLGRAVCYNEEKREPDRIHEIKHDHKRGTTPVHTIQTEETKPRKNTRNKHTQGHLCSTTSTPQSYASKIAALKLVR
jgi:hypothetical protein